MGVAEKAPAPPRMIEIVDLPQYRCRPRVSSVVPFLYRRRLGKTESGRDC